MENLQLLVDLYKEGHRQGPGADSETRLAIALAGLSSSQPLKIADIGCGTGASAFILAQELNAQITAVDFLPDFLVILEERAQKLGLLERITTINASMNDLPFAEAEYDVIWSEGAIYNMGFENGLKYWQRFLKPGGILAVSELTWLTSHLPEDLQEYWKKEYPEVDSASAKMALLEQHSYSPLAYFVLPQHCWLKNFYSPLEGLFPRFLAEQPSEDAKLLVNATKQEIEFFKKYSMHYGYGFYIAQKL
jgi:SAM-dependent methyltransferase